MGFEGVCEFFGVVGEWLCGGNVRGMGGRMGSGFGWIGGGVK